ncbi:sulfatase-like hydrolase/transferase [Pontiellaceae bacterium B12227]|nr:sulfatase-like hydrolase/transferase [Pontiellaceae bacterium B12227]
MKMDKRKFAAALACLMLVSPVWAQDHEQPNVLFIFADDMSYETIGAAGMLDIDTPNLDKLVENGASFTHAYNMGAWGGAVCAASRSMLNCGRFVWQAQSGVKAGVSENRMWSQRMQDAGYQTYMSGKWHVPGADAEPLFNVAKNVRGGMPNDFWRKGSADGTKPKRYGYGRPVDEDDYKNGWKPWDVTNGGFWEGGTHWSEVLANDAVDYLAAAAEDDKPFFMYLAFNASHDPRQSPKEYIDRYPLDRIKLPENFLSQYPYADKICGLSLRDEKLMPYPRTEFAVKVHRQEYFAIITHMDDQIGRIFQALEKSGKADNTYIVFTADHGLACGHHGFSGKQNMYDHSVRVPFLVVGPDVKPGMKIDAPIYLQDVMATSLELAGASSEGVDFKSLLPLLRGESAEHYPEIYGAYMNKQRMITQGDWKFISYPTAHVERLFNLKKDPNEMNDLAANPEYAAKLTQMRGALTQLSTSLGDPLLKAHKEKKKKK